MAPHPVQEPPSQGSFLRYVLPVGLISLLLVPSLTFAPEGVFRDGNHLQIILLWFCLLPPLLYGITCWKTTSFRSRWQLADTFALLFLGSMFLSTIMLWHTKSGNIRYADNMFWTCSLMVWFYFLWRFLQPIRTPHWETTIVLVFLTVALTETILSLYGYFWRDPIMRAAYLANPEEMLASNGFNYPVGSTERILLENRILGSTEPLGTFGLTNTLAGTLVPWVFLLIGILWFTVSSLRRQKRVASSMAACLVVLLPMAIVLVLTKSRSAILALFGGILLLPVATLCRFGLRQWKEGKIARSLLRLWIPLLLLVVTVPVIALLSGAIDREVFTEAGKSLGYRLQYWQSSCHMISDYPWFGIGPGNFQTVYTQYMLPGASETIADPHNFAFEIAAVYGLPALCLFVGFLVFAAWAPFRSLGMEQADPQIVSGLKSDSTIESVGMEEKSIAKTPLLPWGLGSGLGLIFALLYSQFTSAPMSLSFLVSGMASMIILFGVTRFVESWVGISFATLIQKYPMERALLIVGACVVLLVNLLAAGGIFYPATALTLWFLAAAVLDLRPKTKKAIPTDETIASQRSAKSSRIKKRERLSNRDKTPSSVPFSMIGITLAVVGCLLPAIFYHTAVFPAKEGQQLFDLAQQDLVSRKVTPFNFYEKINQGIPQTDPYSLPLLRMRYDSATRLFAESPLPLYQQWWEQSRDELLKQAPGGAGLRESMGEGELSLYRTTSRALFLDSAQSLLAESVRFAPQDAKKRALWSLALWESGKKETAQNAAAEALRLDNETPHLDRKLPPDLKTAVQNICK